MGSKIPLKLPARKPDPAGETPGEDYWEVLIVDDDEETHYVTKRILEDTRFHGRPCRFSSAYSGREAREWLNVNHAKTAVILLDVVMEEDDAGLKVVRHLRQELGNRTARVILRTGQPGQIPPVRIFTEYDINDYKEKTELTAQKLILCLIAGLRDFNDVMVLENHRRELEENRNGLRSIIDSTLQFFSVKGFSPFCRSVTEQLSHLMPGSGSMMAIRQGNSPYMILSATGQWAATMEHNPDDNLTADEKEKLHNSRDMIVTLSEGGSYLHRYQSQNQKGAVFLRVGQETPLTRTQTDLLNLFSSVVHVAFENILINQEMFQTQSEIVTKLSEVVETRSHETAQHVGRVAAFSSYLADKAGLTDAEISNLRIASTLHDIGKVGVPDSILLKEENLTEEEFEVIKNHTVIGYRIMQASSRPILQLAAIISLQHHEKFSGGGYPNNLQGEEIHLYSRIVSIADVFDALTHDRFYKKAWSAERAVAYLIDEKGKSFDPRLVDLFTVSLEDLKEINGRHL
jgi:response regulator RpfG family c-di-GMP phosphodiesterase